MSDVKSYFEKHSHHHAYHRDPSSYSQTMADIRQILGSSHLNILDVGCGDGSFIRGLTKSGIEGKFFGIDLSHNLVSDASKQLRNATADLLVGDGFNLPLREEIKFDLIHLDSVLHHIIGKSRQESRQMARKFLAFLHERLSEHGIIVVEEIYIVSFLFPELTSSIIFYGLKLMNKLHINLSSLNREFQPGLEVNFFSGKTLEGLFKQYSEKTLQIKLSKVPLLFRVFLTKDYGRITYVTHR
jgi:SAM-dependent methyltransferase